MLYWRIGKRINTEILKGERADYRKEIVVSLSRQLVADYGNGFSVKTLRHMIRFAEGFPDQKIVSTLWRQLSWSHFKEIIYLKYNINNIFHILYNLFWRIAERNPITFQKIIYSKALLFICIYFNNSLAS